MMMSEVSEMRWRISSALNLYSGSHETTDNPAAVASALKLAGPSAQPKIRPCRSSEESANMRQYSSNDLPHGTTWDSVNTAHYVEKGLRWGTVGGVGEPIRSRFPSGSL